MLIQRLWRKKAFVVVAMVFILTLFAFNLDALVRGKVEVNKAEAWKFLIFGLHDQYERKIWTDWNQNGHEDPGEVVIDKFCNGNGFKCFAIYLPIL